MTGGTDGPADFAGFVAARSQRLLRTAYLLTQDRSTAEDLLQTALAKSWQAWGRIDDDPEPYVRAVLVNMYTSWWRRRWWGEIATGEPPEVAHPRGDTRPVFVLTCGQPGRLSPLINGHDVGTVNCADAAWSAQVLPVSAQSLASAGWVPGRKELLALGWEGMSWAYVGVAVYSD